MRPTPSRTASLGIDGRRGFQVGRLPTAAPRTSATRSRPTPAGTGAAASCPSLTVASRPRGAFLRASDPAVAYDDAPRALADLDARHQGRPAPPSSSAARRTGCTGARRSTAGRRSRTCPTASLLDKEWIACDNGASSPFRGHCYVSYSDIDRLVARHPDVGRRRDVPGRRRSASPDHAGRRGIQGAYAPGAAAGRTSRTGTSSFRLFDGELSAIRSTGRRRHVLGGNDDRAVDFQQVPGCGPRRYRARRSALTAPFLSGLAGLCLPPGLLGKRHRLLEVPQTGSTGCCLGQIPLGPGEPRDRWDRSRPRYAWAVSRSRTTPRPAASSTSTSSGRATAASTWSRPIRLISPEADALPPDRRKGRRRHGRGLHLDLVRRRPCGLGLHARPVAGCAAAIARRRTQARSPSRERRPLINSIWHAVGVFWAHLADLGWGALGIGIVLHVLRLLCVSRPGGTSSRPRIRRLACPAARSSARCSRASASTRSSRPAVATPCACSSPSAACRTAAMRRSPPRSSCSPSSTS